MSLFILHTENSCGWGGQELRILSEATGLAERGHRVEIACPQEAPLYEEAKKAGLATHAAAITRKNPRGLLALRRLLRQLGPDVVNSHSSTDSWLSALAARTTRRPWPIVRSRHISAPVAPTAANRWLYGPAVARVVTTGERLRRELMEGLGLAASHVLSVPTGVDLQRFQPPIPEKRALAREHFGIEETTPTLAIAATLRSWKGHDDLLDALKMLLPSHPNLRLLVAGDGPQRERLETRVRKEGLEAAVHFLGHVTDVPKVFAAADIMALPSWANEGVPQALMQAMACGLPVVSTPVGSIGELLDEGHVGLMTPPRDPAALAAALSSLLADPSRRRALGDLGRERVVAHYSRQAMLDTMEQVFTLAARG